MVIKNQNASMGIYVSDGKVLINEMIMKSSSSSSS